MRRVNGRVEYHAAVLNAQSGQHDCIWAWESSFTVVDLINRPNFYPQTAVHSIHAKIACFYLCPRDEPWCVDFHRGVVVPLFFVWKCPASIDRVHLSCCTSRLFSAWAPENPTTKEAMVPHGQCRLSTKTWRLHKKKRQQHRFFENTPYSWAHKTCN